MTQTKLTESFLIAARGVIHEISKERNIKIQIIIGLCVIVISILLKISKIDFVIILLVSFLVIILELLNKGFEKLIDVISPDYNKELGRVKDITAAAVLLGAILATVVGLLILYEPIMRILQEISKFFSPLFLIIANIIIMIVILLYHKNSNSKKLK